MCLNEAREMTLETVKHMEEIEGFIEVAMNGDNEAFIYLMEEYKIDMYRMGKVILDNDDDIGDAMQETVLKAYKNLKNLQNVERFKSWLLKIMVNECNNILRVKKKVVLFDKIFKEETYVDNYNLEKQPMLEAIKKLDDNFKKVILLYYYEDLSIRDVAGALEISEGTVKSRLSRARKKLFNFLNTGQKVIPASSIDKSNYSKMETTSRVKYNSEEVIIIEDNILKGGEH